MINSYGIKEASDIAHTRSIFQKMSLTIRQAEMAAVGRRARLKLDGWTLYTTYTHRQWMGVFNEANGEKLFTVRCL